MTWLTGLTDWLTALLSNRPALAVVLGLISSLALTQWAKFVLLHTDWLPDPQRWIVRAIALPVGATATYLTLPDTTEPAVRVLIGLAVGAAAPYVYQVVTAVLYRLWPSLEARLSVDPYGDQVPPP